MKTILKKALYSIMTASISASMCSVLGLQSYISQSASASSDSDENVLYFENYQELISSNPADCEIIKNKIERACKHISEAEDQYHEYGIICSQYQNKENFVLLYDDSRDGFEKDETKSLRNTIKNGWAEGYVNYLTALKDLIGVSHEYLVIKTDIDKFDEKVDSKWNGSSVNLKSGAFTRLATAIYYSIGSKWYTGWAMMHESSHAYKGTGNIFNYHDEIAVNLRMIAAMHINEESDSVPNIFVDRNSGMLAQDCEEYLHIYGEKNYYTTTSHLYLTKNAMGSSFYEKFVNCSDLSDYYSKFYVVDEDDADDADGKKKTLKLNYYNVVYNQNFWHEVIILSCLMQEPLWNYNFTQNNFEAIENDWNSLDWTKLYALLIVDPDNTVDTAAKNLYTNYTQKQNIPITCVYNKIEEQAITKRYKEMEISNNVLADLKKEYPHGENEYDITTALVMYYNIMDFLSDDEQAEKIRNINDIKNSNNISISDVVKAALNPPVMTSNLYYDTATFTIEEKKIITAQPVDAHAYIGDTAVFSVTAAEDGLSYQWQYNNGSGWKNSTAAGARTNCVSIAVTAARNGQQYRCIVSNADGERETSAAATMRTLLKITSQPQSQSGSVGDTLNFSVTASGAGLTYQWQYYNTTSKKWVNTTLPGNQTAALHVLVKANYNNRKYRCKITDANGTVLNSANAVLTVLFPLGDVDLNGIVEQADATLLADYIGEDPDAVITNTGLINADVNQDGILNMIDVELIMQMIG